MRFLLVLLLLSAGISAQTLSGTIRDQTSGEPLPFASIYVQDTGTGAVSNENGLFSVRLKGGENTVIFQYLGYQTLVRRISGSQGSLDIELIPEALKLDEVEVLSSGEDLSYSVIRRAISKADYHRNQLDKYTADVYIKGGGRVNKIPKLYLKLAPKEDREEMEKVLDRNFTSESMNEIAYSRPNNFSSKTLSKLVVGNEDFEVGPYIFSSFYQPEVAGIISPLSPKAFAYYRFEHEGVSVDQDELINKIRVVPRSRGEGVFEGYIYIVQDDWSLHSLDLTTYATGFTINIRQNLNEIQDRVWLPTTTNIEASGKFFGIEVEANYLASISNYVIELNPDLQSYVEVIDEKSNPDVAAAVLKKGKSADLQNTLAEGGEITNKQLRKVLKEYAKEERKKQEDPEIEYSVSYERDSIKKIRDADYWAEIRPIPLTPAEVKGYELADSIAIVEKQDSIEEATGLEQKTDKSGKTKKSNFFTRVDYEILGGFNPVEGYTAGAELKFPFVENRIRKDTVKYKYRIGGLKLRSHYGFDWNRGSFEADLIFGRTDKPKKGYFLLTGGRSLRQFDPDEAINPYINAFTALFFGDNYINLYERAFGAVNYSRQFSDPLNVRIQLAYEDRRAWENQTNRRLFRNDAEDEFRFAANAPVNLEIGEAPVTELRPAATVDFLATYQTGIRYYMRNGEKRMIGNNQSPELGLRVRAGVPEIGNSASDFALLEGSYRHRFEVGRKGNVDLLVRGGSFLNDSYVGFPDYKHFSTSEIFLTSIDPIGSYRLLPYYLNSTAREYAEVYAHYQFRKFLFTQIWQLHLMGIKEDLFVNYLHTPTSENYTEIGYSIDNILRFLRLEFVTSFRDGKYEDFGVRLSVSSAFGRNND